MTENEIVRAAQGTAPASRFVDADARVLEDRELRPGAEAGSRFGDDMWDLYPAILRENVGPTEARLHFDRITDPITRLTVKELLYARLHAPPPPWRPVSPESLRVELGTIRAVLRDMARWGATRFADVTPAMLEPYPQSLRERGLPYIRRTVRINVLLHAFDFGDRLTYDRLGFAPWRRGPRSHIAGPSAAPDENATPRIPETVMGPYFEWALRYVEDFAEPIIAAAEREVAMIRPAIAPVARRGRLWTAARHTEELRTYVERLRCEGRGLPDNPNRRPKNGNSDRDPARINLKRIERELGFCCGTLRHKSTVDCVEQRTILRDAAAELGFECDRIAAADPESLESLLGHGLFGVSIHVEAHRLIVAAYVVVAYLSGMRDSEVQAMRRGCLRVERSADGVVERLKVQSRVYKGRVASGDVADWVVIEPVATAVRVLERLQAVFAPDSSGILFLGLRRARKGGALGRQVVRHLNAFRDHVNALAARSRRTLPVPEVDGKPWQFTTRQFRRTLAWYLANRPMGIIAALLQYKHAGVAIMEGYAGLSESGFPLELEQEEALAAHEAMFDRYVDWDDGTVFTGPGGEAMMREFAEIRRTLGDTPGQIADEQRVRAMLRSTATQVHPGPLCDCFYVRDHALCRKHAVRAPTEDGPLFTTCEPTRCPNAVVGEVHRPRWRVIEADIDLRLSNRHLPVLQRTVLERDKARVAAVTRPNPEPRRSSVDTPNASRNDAR